MALAGSLLVGGSLMTSALVEASPASAAAVVVQTINVGCSPGAISSDGTHVWVSTYCPPPELGVPPFGGMQEINASDTSEINKVFGRLAGPSGISSDGTHVWATWNGVTEVNSSNGSVVQTIGVGNDPLGISSDGTHVWVTNDYPGNGTVTELNAFTRAVVQTIGVGNFPWAISSDGTHVWVTNSGDNTVSELNAATGAVVQTIGVGSGPFAISSDGTHVWVANQGDNTVTELSASDGSVVDTIGVGSGPSGISSDGTHVWVSNSGDNTVTELNASDGSVVDTIGVGSGPSGISSDGNHVWVSNTGGTTVSEIAIPPSTSVGLPANNATISGTTQYLDASASAGVTKVIYEVSGGPSDLSDVQVATGTATLIGWLAAWNTTTVPNGTYTLQSVATNASGISGTSAGITVTVKNPPTTSVLIPSNGATLSGSTYLDASASNATSVGFVLFGGSYGYSGQLLCTATPTLYGWLCAWNSATVPNGTYTLLSGAINSAGMAFSSGVRITVTN